jgi:rubredoxin
VKRGPQARTDIENEKALADLASEGPWRRPSRPTTRRTAIVEEVDEFDFETEAPKRNSKTKSASKWGDRHGRWKCPTCKTWTRDPSHRACLACRKHCD